MLGHLPGLQTCTYRSWRLGSRQYSRSGDRRYNLRIGSNSSVYSGPSRYPKRVLTEVGAGLALMGEGSAAGFTGGLAPAVGATAGCATARAGDLAAGPEEAGAVTITGLTAPAGMVVADCEDNAGLIRELVVGATAVCRAVGWGAG